MSRRSELGLERFDYSRVGSEWAVLRVLARLGAELGAPADARLTINCAADGEGLSYPARAQALERRLLGCATPGHGGSGTELLWRASFAVPLEVVECQQAVFELTGLGGLALALPPPGARIITHRQLALAPIRHRDQHPRIAVGQVRQRCVALATAVVVTTTSTPAIALAAGGGSTPTGSSQPLARPASASQATPTSTPASGTPAAAPSPPPAAPSPAPAPSPTAAAPATAAPQAATSAPQPKTTAPASAGSVTAGKDPTSSSAHAAPSRGSTSSAGATASRRRVTPDLAQKPARHGGLTHPAVTLFFSAGARRAHQVTKPASKPPACVSATGKHMLAATFTPATADGTAHPSPATQIRCTPPAAPKAVKQRKPGVKQHKPGVKQHKPAAEQPRRQGASFTPGGAPAGDGRGRRTFPAGAGAHGQPVLRGKNGSGGAAVQPLGGLSKHPGVKLGSGSSTGSVPTLSSSPPGFLGPASWTGTVSADPALTGAVTDLSGLLSNGDRPPSFLIPIYMQAGHRYGVPWEVLAAINAIESDYGRDLSTSSAGALGWMQFEPGTWREWGVAADRHSVPNPYDPRDAIFSAARYLAAAGAAQNISTAVFAYNHAGWYVDEVLSRAQAIAAHVQFERQTVKHGSFSVYFATGFKKRPTVRYSGGTLSHYDRVIASANMVSAANFPYLYGGGHEQPAQFQPFDCSGSVSFVIQQAGFKVPTTVSGEIPIWKFPSGPGRVTIFYNPTHTFMRIGNRYFGTSGFARPAGGAGWFDVDKLPAGYLSEFREVHVPRLGVNSFAPVTPRPSTSS